MDVNIPFKVFNKAYRPYIDNTKRFLIFYGGASSGKSYFVAQRYIYKLMVKDLCNLLVVREVANTNRDSTFALLKQVINQWGLEKIFKISEGDMRITCLSNGNSVIFKGLDDPEKLKSVTFERGVLSDIWVEEASEIDEAALNQLNVRLRGKYVKKQIVLTFNPIDVNHWLKKRFFDSERPNTDILHTTYKDNKFLSEDDKAELEAYKETDPYYYDVYCRGLWGVYGDSVFDKNNINQQLGLNVKPVKTGCFLYEVKGDFEGNIHLDKIRFSDYEPMIKIYKEPEKGHPYVIGGDTAGEGSDCFTGQVIDNSTGQQVAVFKRQYDSDLYAKQMYCLGTYYNTALIAPEVNYSSYEIEELRKMHYRKLYVRPLPDTYTGEFKKSYGFKTTGTTRPNVIAGLVKVMREHPEWICDVDTLNEMLTFVRNPKKKGRPEAQNGAHDDLVMGLAIAYYARGQQRTKVDFHENTKYGYYTEEMLKDYMKASPSEKIMLKELWGEPRCQK